MATRTKWNRNAATEIMKSAEMQSEIGSIVNAAMARLDPSDYEGIVEDGGDRTRGAVWTKSAAGMRRTAQNSELLNALGGAR